MPAAGGCQCGAVRYELSGQLPPVYACHCSECKRQSGSAFALSLPVLAENLSVIGPLSSYARQAASGAITHCYFCASCGTRIYHQSSRSPDRMTIKAGTLDDAAWLVPVAHLWVSRKQPWLEVGDTPSFKTQPEDLKGWRSALMEARHVQG